MALEVEIVSARGVDYHAEGVTRVVVRRREPFHDPGSEIAICEHHAPLLMQVQPCRMRITCGGSITERDIPGGILEVFRDHVTVAIT